MGICGLRVFLKLKCLLHVEREKRLFGIGFEALSSFHVCCVCGLGDENHPFLFQKVNMQTVSPNPSLPSSCGLHSNPNFSQIRIIGKLTLSVVKTHLTN